MTAEQSTLWIGWTRAENSYPGLTYKRHITGHSHFPLLREKRQANDHHAENQYLNILILHLPRRMSTMPFQADNFYLVFPYIFTSRIVRHLLVVAENY